MTAVRALAACMLLALACTTARAHDSWLVPDGAGWRVATGARYPRAELTAPPDSISRSGCTAPGACWVELREFDIELDPKLVEVYFREARPSPAVRERWQALHAQGRPWRERYRKFMRVDSGSAPSQPAGLDLELVRLGEPPRLGEKARFVLLSRNQPVASQPVELVSERSPLGVWSRTNERGEVEWTLPFAGQWLVRTISIDVEGGERFASRFATLIFEAR